MMKHSLIVLVSIIILTFLYPQTVGIARTNSSTEIKQERPAEDSLNEVLQLNLKIIGATIRTVEQQQTIIQLQTKYYESNKPNLAFGHPKN